MLFFCKMLKCAAYIAYHCSFIDYKCSFPVPLYMHVWFNPFVYNVNEDAGVATLIIERIGANGIPVNISITTQDLDATGMVNTSTV